MRAVNIADLKNNLSRYLDDVRRGGEVLVKDRNKPIARIVPLVAEEGEEAELIELMATGSVKPPKSRDPLPKSFWRERLPTASLDLLELLREDRDAR